MQLRKLHWTVLHRALVSLASKAVYEGVSALSETDVFVAAQALLVLSKETNFDYVVSRRGQLIRLTTLVKIIVKDTGLCKNEEKQQSIKQIQVHLLARDAIPTAHSYFGNYSNIRSAQMIQRGSKRKQSFAPKKFIGVGYKDKGNMKIPHYDGTPSWQEVANQRLPDTSRAKSSRKYQLYWTEWGYRKDL
jgi:hypothetical protein